LGVWRRQVPRLKKGINVHGENSAFAWFLNDKDDFRSSDYLKDPATGFDIQEPELGWAGGCWDADFHLASDRSRHKATIASSINRSRTGLAIFATTAEKSRHFHRSR
jgi:hypothetical protein